MPLNVFLINAAVGNADGFCLKDPVPKLVSFDGLITETVDGVILLLLRLLFVSAPTKLLPPAALDVDEVVDDVDAATAAVVEIEDVVVEFAEPAANTEGDFIETDRPLELLGV